MSSTTLEAVIYTGMTALFLVLSVTQGRRGKRENAIAAGILTVVALGMVVANLNGVLFVGPGGHGGVGLP